MCIYPVYGNTQLRPRQEYRVRTSSGWVPRYVHALGELRHHLNAHPHNVENSEMRLSLPGIILKRKLQYPPHQARLRVRLASKPSSCGKRFTLTTSTEYSMFLAGINDPYQAVSHLLLQRFFGINCLPADATWLSWRVLHTGWWLCPLVFDGCLWGVFTAYVAMLALSGLTMAIALLFATRMTLGKCVSSGTTASVRLRVAACLCVLPAWSAAEVLFSWSQIAVGSKLSIRAVVPSGESCPDLHVDSRVVKMGTRAHPEPGVRRRRDGLARVVFVGDTGCRVSRLLEQDCKSPTIGLRDVLSGIANQNPDLVVHVGDYLYREVECTDKSKCDKHFTGIDLNLDRDWLSPLQSVSDKLVFLFCPWKSRKLQPGS
ncbi:hypothetical protein GH714_042534 [Hevea brasiliensis]|uniref:Uncharacterized protein n=1 Tax=Hevea brasiliensis TaxID=3981 RepID=A0A6A6JYM3_HEVBR|nr:hypothetical protein GH714_042534 [Hevea brasiliensis]